MDYPLLGVFGILTIVSVAVIAPRLGVAAPLLLVLIGIAASLVPGVPAFDFPPELILAVVLPPLLYSAAVNVPLHDFRRNATAITGLSVLLVIVSAVASGALFHWLLPGLSVPAALALGAVVSPTDAVAATSMGCRLGLPPRVVTLLEGEGLLNDASALVLLRCAIAATAGGVSLIGVAGDFAFAVGVAIGIGLVVGHLTVWLRSRLGNVVLNTTISFAVPFLAFIPTDHVHASGVLAVVVAGLVTGHRGPLVFTAEVRISERVNWRTIQFVLENGVFLLMGFELKYLVGEVHEDHVSVIEAVGIGLLATVVLVVVRGAFVVPLIAQLKRQERRARAGGREVDSALRRLRTASHEDVAQARAHRRLTRKRADLDFQTVESLGWRDGAVLGWSGMRGVVALAAAQSLPTGIPYRPQLIFIAFTVALVTLIVQGGTLPLLIRRLGLTGSAEADDQRGFAALVGQISAAGLESLGNPALAQDGGEPFTAEALSRVRADSIRRAQALDETAAPATGAPHHQHRALRLHVLARERAALLNARETGAYGSHLIERAQRMLDLEETRLSSNPWA
ncbi:sodium:proton antiporter [Cryobacterium sp. RTC2.1]|uniref:cation:proton antiporter n=1 Tax=Cryobacterium sp. RTC2.1 TaxID=3048634 RepID=UPI002B2266BD|nr:sodium:proton antiporter [Cryobacterium sp. RTC2.1]MEB0002359.1 sodium:proton antiporter [Cryobacterium sp. RTC2.1]